VACLEHALNGIGTLCPPVHLRAAGSVVLDGDPATIREHHTVGEKYLGEGLV
jgi:ABC-type branched-subunit amino acid transport system ATPase component